MVGTVKQEHVIQTVLGCVEWGPSLPLGTLRELWLSKVSFALVIWFLRYLASTGRQKKKKKRKPTQQKYLARNWAALVLNIFPDPRPDFRFTTEAWECHLYGTSGSKNAVQNTSHHLLVGHSWTTDQQLPCFVHSENGEFVSRTGRSCVYKEWVLTLSFRCFFFKSIKMQIQKTWDQRSFISMGLPQFRSCRSFWTGGPDATQQPSSQGPVPPSPTRPEAHSSLRLCTYKGTHTHTNTSDTAHTDAYVR